jgi:hypothetical protein
VSNILSRRLLLRGLPMAPAMAKQAVGEIVKQAVSKSVATFEGGSIFVGGSVPGGSDAWDLAHKWTLERVRAGIIPDHKVHEYRRQARLQARAGYDPDVEALGSISNSYRRRMHEESAYRAVIRQDIEDHDSRNLFQSILDKFSGRKA